MLGDFSVNQSKVITLQGGDILIYSSQETSMPAGARSTRERPLPPRRITDPQTGLTFFQPPLDASGSGIRTLSSDPDGPGPLKAPKPGDVFLFAPSGFIDAGEAGVSSAGNIFVAALQVFNSNNFSAAGSSVGVPAAPAGGISAGLAGASNVGQARRSQPKMQPKEWLLRPQAPRRKRISGRHWSAWKCLGSARKIARRMRGAGNSNSPKGLVRM